MTRSAGGEEGFEFFGGFATKSRHGGNFLDAGDLDFLDGSKVLEEGSFAHFAHAGKFVKKALGDFFQAETGVVGVGEAVGFVADALEEFESAGMTAEAKGKRSVRQVNFFEFFCQTNDGNLFQSQFLKFAKSGIELAFASVNKNEVGHVGGKRGRMERIC